VNFVRRFLRAAFDRAAIVLDRIFGPADNPLSHLGALGFFFYWIVVATGFHLYAGFDTAVAGSYASVEHLSRSAWFLGGVSRSLHRYASDALVGVMFLHMLREFALDRYRGVRWFSWAIGLPIVILVYASGISGYWLVWDRLAQYIAIATTEFLDWLPFFGEPIARNFLAQAYLDDRFFTLLVFLHIAVPLILVFVLWIHLQRISRPGINPPRRLAFGTAAMLIALSVVFPATSQSPADLGKSVTVVGLDWFYLPLYPLVDVFSAGTVWGVLTAALLLFAALPWLPPFRPRASARVNLDYCNGCARCSEDCPYAAISLAPRSDGKPFDAEAVVNPSLCVSCGICVGACPPSTPFRSSPDLPTGIDLPDPSLRRLRELTRAAAGRGGERPRVLVFGCEHGARGRSAAAATVTLPCIGMLPPSFVDWVLSRDMADGVLLSGCGESSCYHRLGIRWTAARLAATRDPRLRARVPRERVATCWAGRQERGRLDRAVADFGRRLSSIQPSTGQPIAARIAEPTE
jgi:ferredoxin/coenzyme F420-reducing hydrogenase delta subunit